MSTNTWRFDSDVAKTFVAHAQQHIPNYDLVIDKCLSLVQHHLGSDSAIIDIGCATGETIRRLYTAGFTNLHGVEASQAMLDHCDPEMARYYHSDQFPDQKFDAVLCNWTLHFMRDKISYLTDIHRNLTDRGFMVLSDKTSLDPVCIKQYHRWKSSQGVTDEQILAKEAAVKDIMFINDPGWYLDRLREIGFRDLQIIDAHWCFTTFLCYK